MVSKFNGPLVGVKEQIAILLHEASKALCKNPPQIEAAKKHIYGVTLLLERNEVIDPDFEWLQHLQNKKETEENMQKMQREITNELRENEGLPPIKTSEDILKEFGW
jgi:hypothetical protein